MVIIYGGKIVKTARSEIFSENKISVLAATTLLTMMKIPPYFIQRAVNFGWFWSITEAGRFHLYEDFSDGDDDGEAKMFGNFTTHIISGWLSLFYIKGSCGKLLSESYREEFDQWYLPQARLHILS